MRLVFTLVTGQELSSLSPNPIYMDYFDRFRPRNTTNTIGKHSIECEGKALLELYCVSDLNVLDKNVSKFYDLGCFEGLGCKNTFKIHC